MSIFETNCNSSLKFKRILYISIALFLAFIISTLLSKKGIELPPIAISNNRFFVFAVISNSFFFLFSLSTYILLCTLTTCMKRWVKIILCLAPIVLSLGYFFKLYGVSVLGTFFEILPLVFTMESFSQMTLFPGATILASIVFPIFIAALLQSKHKKDSISKFMFLYILIFVPVVTLVTTMIEIVN